MSEPTTPTADDHGRATTQHGREFLEEMRGLGFHGDDDLLPDILAIEEQARAEGRREADALHEALERLLTSIEMFAGEFEADVAVAAAREALARHGRPSDPEPAPDPASYRPEFLNECGWIGVYGWLDNIPAAGPCTLVDDHEGPHERHPTRAVPALQATGEPTDDRECPKCGEPITDRCWRHD